VTDCHYRAMPTQLLCRAMRPATTNIVSGAACRTRPDVSGLLRIVVCAGMPLPGNAVTTTRVSRSGLVPDQGSLPHGSRRRGISEATCLPEWRVGHCPVTLHLLAQPHRPIKHISQDQYMLLSACRQ
jgi:hypothetical protein